MHLTQPAVEDSVMPGWQATQAVVLVHLAQPGRVGPHGSQPLAAFKKVWATHSEHLTALVEASMLQLAQPGMLFWQS
jgi:hypothetical protein